MNSHSADGALLLLRLALGGILIVHGLNKVFGTGGLSGTERWFDGLGFRPAWLHARLAVITEIGSGLLMILGLATSLAAAGFVGLMVVAAATDHRDKGFFVFKGGWEYVAFIAIAAVALACLGPGAWSVDHCVGLTVSGLPWSIASLVVGLGGALFLLKTGRRTVAQPSAANRV